MGESEPMNAVSSNRVSRYGKSSNVSSAMLSMEQFVKSLPESTRHHLLEPIQDKDAWQALQAISRHRTLVVARNGAECNQRRAGLSRALTNNRRGRSGKSPTAAVTVSFFRNSFANVRKRANLCVRKQLSRVLQVRKCSRLESSEMIVIQHSVTMNITSRRGNRRTFFAETSFLEMQCC